MTTSIQLIAAERISERLASAVGEGLVSRPKRLPPWLFYDEAGSELFEQITGLPEYYLTRTERAILAKHSDAMIARAADGQRLRIAELGAGSASKTRLLLAAATRRQGAVIYEPMDVSLSALAAAQERIELELPGVEVAPRLVDYAHEMELEATDENERRLMLYIGSSIGNFEPEAAALLLRRIRASLQPGDGLLLGVDLVKKDSILRAAYDDAAGVTAAFNRNLLARLNRELGAEFVLETFAHRAVWNSAKSRMEMYLESEVAQSVRVAGLDLDVDFSAGERIHTENSYKYRPGQAEAMLGAAGFSPVERWMDTRRWFAVCLGRVEEVYA